MWTASVTDAADARRAMADLAIPGDTGSALDTVAEMYVTTDFDDFIANSETVWGDQVTGYACDPVDDAAEMVDWYLQDPPLTFDELLLAASPRQIHRAACDAAPAALGETASERKEVLVRALLHRAFAWHIAAEWADRFDDSY